MKLPELVQTVIASRTMNPAMEDQINSLLWSQHLDQQDLDALGQLIEALEHGTVYSLSGDQGMRSQPAGSLA